MIVHLCYNTCKNHWNTQAIDLLAILRKSLDRALFLDIFVHEARLNGVRASIILCTFENSTKCNEISFDTDSFSE